MVGTTIQAALAKGTTICMLFLLPFVCHCLQYSSTTLGRVIYCTKVWWVGGVQRVIVAGWTFINPFPFSSIEPTKYKYDYKVIKEMEWRQTMRGEIMRRYRGKNHSSQGNVPGQYLRFPSILEPRRKHQSTSPGLPTLGWSSMPQTDDFVQLGHKEVRFPLVKSYQ